MLVVVDSVAVGASATRWNAAEFRLSSEPCSRKGARHFWQYILNCGGLL